ncbi:unnamed protein product [Cylicocyclus nassatus]|uniref:Piezo-type mechanosensitive ion channel component n=1 Tax=Cylicocyclus nassatus TaxID=53992 RepID=A0AA36M6Z1_CYLNA|nr:unnamed protein product [Cylicocyclus nassatus]
MVAPFVKYIAYRGILPLSLLFAAFIRPCFMSIGYVIFALLSPILPSIHAALPLPGSIRVYSWACLLYCFLTTVAMSAYQIYEAVQNRSEKEYIKHCNDSDLRWLRYAGLVKFHGGEGFESTNTILPEIAAFFASVISFVIVAVLPHRRENLDVVGPVRPVRMEENGSNVKGIGTSSLVIALKRFSNFAIIVLCAIVGCIQPSLLNIVYFLSFLFVASWWALYKPLRHGVYNKVKKFLLFFAALHILVIYIYQIPIIQQLLPGSSIIARIIGLSPIMLTDCSSWYTFWFNLDLQLPAILNPMAVLVFYHALMVQLLWTYNGSRNYVDDNDGGSSVHEELLTPQEGEDVDNGHSIPLRKVTSQIVDRHKIGQIFGSQNQAVNVASQGMVAIISFALYHSYTFALLSMMVWALLYHSIFGLILLVLSCTLWVFKDSRGASFAMAPTIMVYVEFLLLVQYFCSMNITKEELNLPDWLKMVGIVIAANMWAAFVTLTVKLLLSLPVFLLLRLSIRETFYNNLSEHERARRIQNYGTFTGDPRVLVRTPAGSDVAADFVHWLSKQITKCSIFFVALVLLLVACQSNPVLYTIGFFCIWSLLIIYFKTSFGFFCRIAYPFWLSLIIYTSVVIISLYVYQFPDFPDVWTKWTGLDKKWNDDIGLINYSNAGESGTLFVRLFTPISLFVVTMLQLKFFHEPWLALVRRGPYEQEPGTSQATISAKLVRWINNLIDLIWRFTEVHIAKIVFIVVAVFAAKHICALYVPLVVLVSLALLLPSAVSCILSLVMCSYLCVVAVVKMIYQLSHFPDLSFVNNGEVCNATKTFPEWIGIRKETNTWQLLGGMVVAIIALALQSVVVYRQRHHRRVRGIPESSSDRVFPSFQFDDFDRSMTDCLKFIVDFGFYKFGFEICMIMMGINAWVRMDMLGAVMCVWLAVFALNKRSVCRKLWYIFLIYLAILFPLQYVVYVGLPEDSCLAYPWDHFFGEPSSSTKNVNFNIWMGLANYAVDWPAENLIADFFLLLLASCQMTVFRTEGNDNDSIFVNEDYSLKPNNPRYDFIATQRSFVDFIKIGVFHYGHWVTLIMTLVAGIGGTSLFALGYIMLTFWILWKGNNLYVMNAHTNSFKSTLAKWKTLLSYTVFCMFCKVALQLVGCVFLEWFFDGGGIHKSMRCTIRQLFSIVCVNTVMQKRKEAGAGPLFPYETDLDRTCSVIPQEAQIGFDVIALAFLVFQIRVFHSWFFQHCMVEYRSEIILANRGAVLKNQLIEKEMKEQNEQQSAKFDEIRKRTAAIRERYNKQMEKGESILDPQTYAQAHRYYEDEDEMDEEDFFRFYYEAPSDMEETMRIPPAKRAGDYYMFDYDPSTDELVKPVESFVPEPTPGATKFEKLDPGQLVYAATGHDLDLAKTLEQVREAEKMKTNEDRMIEAMNKEYETPAGTPPSTAVEPSTDIAAPPQQQQESKVAAFFKFMLKMAVNGLEMLSAYLNRLSREHRYVAYVLKKEKEKLKEGHSESLSDTSRKLTDVRKGLDMTNLLLVQSEGDIQRMESAALTDWQQRSVLAKFVNAVGSFIAANTDLLCYLLAVLAHASGAGIITLPLPLMVFFWGTLSNPRPSKFFWVAMIAYTEFVIVTKFICQFTIFDFNSISTQSKQAADPLTPEKVLGVQRQNNFAAYDVPLLFALFFHRYMLRKLGLWKDANLTVTFQDPAVNEEEVYLEDATQRSQAGGKSSNGNAQRSPEQLRSDKTERTASDASSSEERLEAGKNAPASSVTTTDARPVNPDTAGNPITRFIKQLFRPKFRYIKDLYPIMFGLDVVAFLIIAFGYSSFGEGSSGNVLGDIQSNRIPLTFVVMLIVMTLLIVIDRGLYLRKWVPGKLAYQFLIVIFLHVWVFFVLPSLTRRSAMENSVARMFYIVKCLYLLVSAWQIRNGYPQLCIGNLLTHAYGLFNMICFKIFMAVPFLFELRTAIDWTWTDTSMPLFDFFNMENFFAVIYNLKCARMFEQSYPVPRGIPKGAIVKYMMGLPMILLIIFLLWCPLLAFSLLNRIGAISIPEKVRMTLQLEGYPPIYEIESQGAELRSMRPDEMKYLTDAMSKRYSPYSNGTDSMKRSRDSVAFLKEYSPSDVLVINLRPESEVPWGISGESLDALIEQLKGNSSINFIVTIEVTRPYDAGKKAAVKHSAIYSQEIQWNSTLRTQWINILNNPGSGETVSMTEAFPSYLLVPSEGAAILPTPLVATIQLNQDNYQRPDNASDKDWFDTLKLSLVNTSAGGVWVVEAQHPSQFTNVYFNASKITYGTHRDRTYVQTIAFVDRAFPNIFAKYLQDGVIAMYVTVVIVAGRVIRGLFMSSPTSVMITEIPNPDFLLKICLDIYLVREAKDFFLEQDLFAKLIFLFRSPSTLIQWTRYKAKRD